MALDALVPAPTAVAHYIDAHMTSAASSANTAKPAVPTEPSNFGLLRSVGKLAAPTTVLAAVQLASQFVETAIAARQGTAALAGWAVILPFSLLMAQMSTGAMGGGVVAAIARALGADKPADAALLVKHAMAIAVTGGLIFALGMGLFAHTMLNAVAGPEAATAATPYALWLFVVGAIPAWLTNTLASVLRGGGRHASAARALLGMWLAYPVLAWAMAEPWGMGLAGVGAAFAIVSWVATGVLAAMVLMGAAGFKPQLSGEWSWLNFKSILSVGAVACALATIANLTTIMVTAQLKNYGTVAVAAYGISARLEFMMIPLSFGIGAALTALVGGAAGAGNWPRARRTAWVGGGLAFLVTGLFGAVTAWSPLGGGSLFTPDPAVAKIAAMALTVIGPAFGGFGLGMAMYFAAMGAHRMGWPIVAAVSRFSLAVGGGYVLAHGLGDFQGLGMQGHFIGVALGISSYGLFAALGVRKAVWSAR